MLGPETGQFGTRHPSITGAMAETGFAFGVSFVAGKLNRIFLDGRNETRLNNNKNICKAQNLVRRDCSKRMKNTTLHTSPTAKKTFSDFCLPGSFDFVVFNLPQIRRKIRVF